MAERSNDTPLADGICMHFSPLAHQKIAHFKGQGLAEYGLIMQGLSGDSFRRVIIRDNGEARWIAAQRFFQDDPENSSYE